MPIPSSLVGTLRWAGLCACVPAMACGRIGFDELRALTDADGAGGDARDRDGAATVDGGAGRATAGTTGVSGAGPGGRRGDGGSVNPGTGGTGNAGGANGGRGGASGGGGVIGNGGGPGTGGNADAATPDASPPDAGDASCSGCTPPLGLALSGTAALALVGGSGGAPHPDVCPADEVLVGFSGKTGAASGISFLESFATICGKPAVAGSAPYGITVTESALLPVRGTDGTDAWRMTCPPDEVVVGFDSRADFYLRQLGIVCAPLTVTSSGSGYRIGIGPGHALPPEGGAIGPVIPTMNCPPGAFARGSTNRSGQVIDAFSIICATPELTFAGPASCVSDASCQCFSYERRDYAFCTAKAASAAARTTCVSRGMRATKIEDTLEDGWLRDTGTQLATPSWYWIGADSNALTNEWRWLDGTLFWQGVVGGTPVPNVYVDWYPFGQPSPSPACVAMVPTGGWEAHACADSLPVICERY